jgi:hypothetical protein
MDLQQRHCNNLKSYADLDNWEYSAVDNISTQTRQS